MRNAIVSWKSFLHIDHIIVLIYFPEITNNDNKGVFDMFSKEGKRDTPFFFCRAFRHIDFL